MSKTAYAISILTGSIIGAGIFSLPYIASKVGIWTMLIYFIPITLIVCLIHVFMGEVSAQTPDFKRFPGFAKMHLGSKGEKVAVFSSILGAIGTLLAYIIVGGEFLSYIFQPMVGGSSFLYTVLFFIIGSVFVFYGIKAIERIELISVILFFVILVLIYIKGFCYVEPSNLLAEFDLGSIFLPYGAIMFSLWGATLIPEVEEILDNKKDLKRVILTSISIAAVISFLFTFIVLGICGENTVESALGSLKSVLGDGLIFLTICFGFLTVFTSFITSALTLKKVFWYDFKIDKKVAWLMACFAPFCLFLAGFKSFVAVVSFVGGVLLGIDGILILLMYKKIKPTNNILIPILGLLLLFGIIYEIFYFLT